MPRIPTVHPLPPPLPRRPDQGGPGAPSPRPRSPLVAGLLAAGLLLAGGVGPAAATPPAPLAAPPGGHEQAVQRLTALVRQAAERMELPPMVPQVRYLSIVGEVQVELDRDALERAAALTRQIMRDVSVTGFRVENADCGPDLCWIRYRYDFAATAGTSRTSGSFQGQEFWVRRGEELLLVTGVGRQ